jgi:MFS superfamily sulfate permease-like transporter
MQIAACSFVVQTGGLNDTTHTAMTCWTTIIWACSMRARVSSRMNGLVVVACELAIFMAPFSVIAYLPLFFFGGLMLWIGYEILKVSPASFLLICSPSSAGQ